MNKIYYQEYYVQERCHWWFRARSRILEAFIRQVTTGKAKPQILNVGIATGATSQLLAQYGTVTSVEYDRDCCQFVREVVGLPVTEGSITDLPFADQSFDLVCAFDVLEHVADDAAGASELIRVCRRGGTVLVTVPALSVLWSEHDEVNQHHRRYRRGQLQQLFTAPRQGAVQFCSYFNTLLFPPILAARLLGKLVSRNRKTDAAQSDFAKFQTGRLDKWLYRIFTWEQHPLIRKRALPIGVSLLLQFQKQ